MTPFGHPPTHPTVINNNINDPTPKIVVVESYAVFKQQTASDVEVPLFKTFSLLVGGRDSVTWPFLASIIGVDTVTEEEAQRSKAALRQLHWARLKRAWRLVH